MNEAAEREFAWDDVITKDGGSYELLPEGDYYFSVKSFQRGRYNGGAKIPPCNQANLEIEVFAEDGASTVVKHSLFLHQRTEGLLSAFFVSIGQKKHGEPLKMNWNAVPGSSGRCHLYIDEWTTDRGETRKNNKIRYFIDPEKNSDDVPFTLNDKPLAAPSAAAAAYAPEQTKMYEAGKF